MLGLPNNNNKNLNRKLVRPLGFLDQTDLISNPNMKLM
jgi:hypothetical protein